MIKSLPPVALVAGPTASGKSALALALARRSGGVIVNADASQIYRDIDVLSARPSGADMAAAEHRLFGLRDGAEPCSAADYAALAGAEIADIHSSGRLPILVGGTGLYIRSLLDGIAPVPPIDPDIRRNVREASVVENRAALLEADPDAAARLNAGDTTRIARALEVALSTGRTLAEWQDRREGGIGQSITLHPLILLPPREWLNRRCDERFAAMLDGRAVTEVEELLVRGLDPDLPVMRAIGVPEIAAMLRGEMTRDEALSAGQLATRRYAKRQYTWFAHQPPLDWPRFHEPLEEATLDEALALLGSAE
jgi:tRNA dimethylallyltransferase